MIRSCGGKVMSQVAKGGYRPVTIVTRKMRNLTSTVVRLFRSTRGSVIVRRVPTIVTVKRWSPGWFSDSMHGTRVGKWWTNGCRFIDYAFSRFSSAVKIIRMRLVTFNEILLFHSDRSDWTRSFVTLFWQIRSSTMSVVPLFFCFFFFFETSQVVENYRTSLADDFPLAIPFWWFLSIFHFSLWIFLSWNFVFTGKSYHTSLSKTFHWQFHSPFLQLNFSIFFFKSLHIFHFIVKINSYFRRFLHRVSAW